MTRPSRPWKCRSARRAGALAILAAGLAHVTPAAAQACCTGGALVSPVRLAPPEDYAVGLQTRARNAVGSFGADGSFVPRRARRRPNRMWSRIWPLRFASRAGHRSAWCSPTSRRTGSNGRRRMGKRDRQSGPQRPLRLRAGGRDAAWPGFASSPTSCCRPARRSARNHPRLDQRDRHRDLQRVAGGRPGEGPWSALRRALCLVDLQRQQHRPSSPARRRGSLTTFVSVAGGRAGGRRLRVRERRRRRALRQLPGTWRQRPQRRDPARHGPAPHHRGRPGLLPIAEDWRLSASVYSDVLLSSFGRNQQAGAGVTASLVRAWR